jgi:TatD DNase family protein
MIIDTHAHLNFKAYKDDLSETIKRSLDNNIWLINVGSEFETSEKAIKIAEKYDQGVYASIGLHPIHAQNEFNYQQYKELAQNQKVVAVGETGLDFKKEYLFLKEKQIQVFLNHLKLAKELDLPIIFHCRLAHQEVIEILKKQEKRQGVIHCFTGDWTAAEEYLKIGLYLGFNGIIFKLNLDETIKKTPLDRILVETDCPFLSPLGAKSRNEPIFVKHVIEKIAQVKGKTFQEIADQTTDNARKLFRI